MWPIEQGSSESVWVLPQEKFCFTKELFVLMTLIGSIYYSSTSEVFLAANYYAGYKKRT